VETLVETLALTDVDTLELNEVEVEVLVLVLVEIELQNKEIDNNLYLPSSVQGIDVDGFVGDVAKVFCCCCCLRQTAHVLRCM